MTRNKIIKLLQNSHFSEEIGTLRKNRYVVIKGKLTRLNPFIDMEGILRVGGRLGHSPMPFAQRHPIIFLKSSGTQATLYAVRQRYWSIDGRGQVWRTVKGCVRSCRANPAPMIGNLPVARVTETRSFTNVGVDYCGSFYIRENRHSFKVYVTVFVCISVKAVHIDLFSDLTSEAFTVALRKFIVRRGFCSTIYSDSGTNFVEANNELRGLRSLLQSDDHKESVQAFLSDRQIE